jgi:uncharacterized LabA/DUF88 family protein
VLLFREIARREALVEKSRVAVLIDAENLRATLADEIFAEAARRGTICFRHVYGDFSQSRLRPWLEAAPRHALTLCQTLSGASGKNAADIAFAIDATEMLCKEQADIFCLVTSDSDFTQLAIRIRQRGKMVIGVGETKTATGFRDACDHFVRVGPTKMKTPASPPVVPAATGGSEGRRKIEPLLLQRAMAASVASDENWVDISQLGHALRSIKPGFCAKSYGHAQLHKLLAMSGVDLRKGEDNRIHARLKAAKLKTVVDDGQSCAIRVS